MRAGVYMMQHGAIHRLSAKVQQWRWLQTYKVFSLILILKNPDYCLFIYVLVYLLSENILTTQLPSSFLTVSRAWMSCIAPEKAHKGENQRRSTAIAFLLTAVNCPLPKPPRDGRIAYDKPFTGSTTVYGQGWTYECNPRMAPSFERGSCMADGSTTEPPVCRGTADVKLFSMGFFLPYFLTSEWRLLLHLSGGPRGELRRPKGHPKRLRHLCCD